MNKFLNLTLKIGKVFSLILLIIVLLVMIGSGIALLTSNNAPLETPSFSDIKQSYLEWNAKSKNTASAVNSTQQSSKDALPYMNKIKKIVRKHHLNNEIPYLIAKNIDSDIDDELINQYLRGLDKFYADSLRFINSSEEFKNDVISEAVYSIEREKRISYDLEEVKKNFKVNGTYHYCVGAGLAMGYHELFMDSIQDKEKLLQEKAAAKTTQQIVLAISVLLFVLLLFLPVLIKIEENTRPVEERETAKKGEDTKACIKCGKQIKADAKKCRYCGTWQNETEQNNGGNE